MKWEAVALLLALTTIPPTDPNAKHDYDIYWEDPCVEAMRKAMATMEDYLPHRATKDPDDGYWYTLQQFTDEGMKEYEDAVAMWKDTKLQCWRSET